MDSDRLKGRPSYPFETIAVAVAFSPRLEAMLSEARQLALAFTAKLLLIHVGKRTSGKETMLREMCDKVGIGKEVQAIWLEGEIVSSLLKTCKENMVDLLILGALRRENVLRYYLGSVARSICRRAKCSLLLLTEPKLAGTKFTRIVVDCVDHHKTLQTLNTASYFAYHAGAEVLQVIKEVDQAGLAMAMSDTSSPDERDAVLTNLIAEAERTILERISHCETGSLAVQSKVLVGRPGFVIRRYAEDSGADLLIINAPDSRYGLIDRIFTHDMEYILEHIPCAIFVVYSRLTVSN